MKIQMFVALRSIAVAGALSSAMASHAYAQGAPVVREIGKHLTGTSSDMPVVQAATAVITAPIVITESGNYRLNSNIRALEGNAIEIRTSFVTLDLNGFLVEAPAGNAVVTTLTPGPLAKIAVINGNVTASRGGVSLAAEDCRIENVQVTGGAQGTGIFASLNCIVKNNTVSRSRVGIECRSCVVSGNSVRGHIDAGISADFGSVVLGNRVAAGTGVGLRLDETTGYAENVLFTNGGGDVTGGVQIGQNLCATSTICPP
jgi:hypothetical protein